MLKYCFIDPELLQMLLGKLSAFHVNESGMTPKTPTHIDFNSSYKKTTTHDLNRGVFKTL